jgi:hypothetical protein
MSDDDVEAAIRASLEDISEPDVSEPDVSEPEGHTIQDTLELGYKHKERILDYERSLLERVPDDMSDDERAQLEKNIEYVTWQINATNKEITRLQGLLKPGTSKTHKK